MPSPLLAHLGAGHGTAMSSGDPLTTHLGEQLLHWGAASSSAPPADEGLSHDGEIQQPDPAYAG